MRLSIDFECVLWEMWLLQMCFIYVVAFTNWNVLRLTQCMFYWCSSHQNTQRRQVKLINVPLKVLCPLFMTKVVEVGSTFRARVAKAMLEKQDYFIIFFFTSFYLPFLPLANRLNVCLVTFIHVNVGIRYRIIGRNVIHRQMKVVKNYFWYNRQTVKGLHWLCSIILYGICLGFLAISTQKFKVISEKNNMPE